MRKKKDISQSQEWEWNKSQNCQLLWCFMATHSSALAWKIPWMEEPGGLQSMWSQSPTQLSDFTFTFPFHALEKAMATHSHVLAWRIPETAEPDELPSMGSHRVGHDWRDLAAAAWCHKNLPDNAGDAGDKRSIRGEGRSPGGGNGNPL